MTEVKVRVKNLQNGKTVRKGEAAGEMIKNVAELVVTCIWKLCNKALKSSVIPEAWVTDLIASLCNCKEERIES